MWSSAVLRPRRAVAAVAGVLLLGGAALVVWSPGHGHGGDVVVSGTGTGAGTSPVAGHGPAAPARAVDLPGWRVAGTDFSVAGAEARDGLPPVPGSDADGSRSESVGNHSVVVVPDGPQGAALVVTNSGSAVADSGNNAGGGSPAGEEPELATGDTDAEGNRSTTHVGP